MKACPSDESIRNWKRTSEEYLEEWSRVDSINELTRQRKVDKKRIIKLCIALKEAKKRLSIIYKGRICNEQPNSRCRT